MGAIVAKGPGKLKFSKDGLIPAIAQDARSGQVLMMAYMNREALRQTVETGFAHYYSRSRGRLWKKGGESGHVQRGGEGRGGCGGGAPLSQQGEEKILRKNAEEASEVLLSVKGGRRQAIVHEVVDLWFHTLVLLGAYGITLDQLWGEFQARVGERKKEYTKRRGGGRKRN